VVCVSTVIFALGGREEYLRHGELSAARGTIRAMRPNSKSDIKLLPKSPAKPKDKAAAKVGGKVNKAWLHDHINDPFVKLARKEGYRARAAYKLKEIDETLGLIKPGSVVVDLGSTPGAWSQYARRKMSPAGAAVGALNGRIIALDLLPMEPIEGVVFIQGDFREPDVLQILEQTLQQTPGPEALLTKVDVVISDMAPNLSGIESADAARISDLIELAVDFSKQHLKADGALIVKVFHGGAYDAMFKLFKDSFKVVKRIKPKASRSESSETFLAGLGLKLGSPEPEKLS
jgi:23S rRNA (uridine2552-2'-O)-methyltransferase